MKTSRTTTTTTRTSTTRQDRIVVPKSQLRLVKRVRTVVVRVKIPKAAVRRIVKSAVPVKRARVVSVTTTRVLPAPRTAVSELTVKERSRLRAPR